MKYLLLAFAVLAFVGCGVTPKKEISIVPLPSHLEKKEGALNWKNGQTVVVAFDNEMFANVAGHLNNMLSDGYGVTVSVDAANNQADVQMRHKELANAEGYELEVSPKGIIISAKTGAGAFYALQTLKQLLPLKSELNGKNIVLPAVAIADEPAFGYRGGHLDVARHFFNADSVKRYIDILTMHKMNTFHWHLTDDQGWRIEIKKYPRLTEVGSTRPRTVIGHNTGEYDSVPVSGFYTQDEVKEIIQYAADRYITIIPEIDMPGHMLAALEAYPELGCRGKNHDYKVAQTWGVFDEVLCAGNDKVYQFAFDVLDEVMALFPSQYIHIGGDECPKTEWEKCPKCQAKIRQLNLKKDDKHSAEQKLQSYFTHEVEKHLNKNGRRLIGWDEIMEGGLSETSTVMAWRGAEYAFEAAKTGNDAILTPTSHLYFDYYQTDDTSDEPMGIGGYVPVQRVYEYVPFGSDAPAELAKHILGVQANLWVEYIKTFRHAEYMLLPRMAALSEVNWSNAPRDYSKFLERMEQFVKQYDEKGYNYARHIFNVSGEVLRDEQTSQISVKLSGLSGADIRFTTDGSEPQATSRKYSAPIAINGTTDVKAAAFYDGKRSKVWSQSFNFNKATSKPIRLENEPNKSYAFKGASTLNDGMVGSKIYRTGRWIGFVNTDMDAIIDMQEPTSFSSVALNSLVITGDWIFRPTAIRVFSSDNGEEFSLVAEKILDQATNHVNQIESYKVDFDTTTARYVKVVAESLKQMPQWHAAKNSPSYIFIDEIAVN